jgi:nicotinamidase/pyrazinamidase
LAVQLKRDNIGRLWIGGLAEDVCVLSTALDARASGFMATLIIHATGPINMETGLNAIIKMKDAGGIDL